MAGFARALWDRLPFDLRWAARRRLPPALWEMLRQLSAPGRERRRIPIRGTAGSPRSIPRATRPRLSWRARNTRPRRLFRRHSAQSLLSPQARALLYQVVRLSRPAEVVEIGAFRGGTTEALARALAAEGRGTVHAVEPFTAGEVRRARRPLAASAAGLCCGIDPTNSMAFFMRMRRRPGLYLIDGNHDYEYAAFDIAAAARHLAPGGFIFIDNVSQAGPFEAAREFLSREPNFFECGRAGRWIGRWPSTASGPESSTLTSWCCVPS